MEEYFNNSISCYKFLLILMKKFYERNSFIFYDCNINNLEKIAAENYDNGNKRPDYDYGFVSDDGKYFVTLQLRNSINSFIGDYEDQIDYKVKAFQICVYDNCKDFKQQDYMISLIGTFNKEEKNVEEIFLLERVIFDSSIDKQIHDFVSEEQLEKLKKIKI